MTEKIEGTIDIKSGVLADLVGYAALECYGIVGVSNANSKDLFLGLLPVNRLRKGVNINMREDGVFVDVYVVVEYGTTISVVCANLRERVQFVLKEYVDIDNVTVNVHVTDVKAR